MERRQLRQCVLDCFTTGLQGTGCVSSSNLECICFSDRYQRSVESCIQDVCPDELGTVVTLMTAQCAEIHGPSSSGNASPTSDPSPRPSTSNLPLDTTTPSLSQSTSTDTNIITPPPFTTQPTNNGTSSKMGAIVGGVVGGIVLGGLFLVLFFWLYRRRSKLRASLNTSYPNKVNTVNTGLIQPFQAVRVTPWSQDTASTENTQPLNRSSQSQYTQDAFSSPFKVNNVAARSMSLNGTSGSPPAYQSTNTNSIVIGTSTGRSAGLNPEVSGSVGISTANHTSNTPDTLYSNLIGEYSAANRDVISPELEKKLRAARYLPTDNPSDMPAEEWGNLHGVGRFELKRLQELYDRKETGVKALKEMHSSGQGGSTWRPSS